MTECNKITTGLILIVLLFCGLVFLFKREFLKPLEGRGFPSLIISIFTYWSISLSVSKALSLLKVAELIGSLLAGIFIRNYENLDKLITNDTEFETFIQGVAFSIIMIRSAMGIDFTALRKNLVFCISISLISSLCEIGAITFITYFSLTTDFKIAFTFASIMAACSPAIIVPFAIKLQENKFSKKGIPSTLIVCASLINVFCIIIYAICTATFFGEGSSTIWLCFSIPFSMVLSVIIGMGFAYVFKYYPTKQNSEVHFQRTVLLVISCLCIYYGGKYYHMPIIGSIAIIVLSSMVTINWRQKDDLGTEYEEKALKGMWVYFLEPLLFSFIGAEFRFKEFSIDLALVAVFILLFGLIFKSISIYVTAHFFKGYTMGEKIFLSISFLSKATVQAALIPGFALMLINTSSNTNSLIAAKFVNMCILLILISAPVGSMLMEILGKRLLTKDPPENEYIMSGGISKRDSINELNITINTNISLSNNKSQQHKVDQSSINEESNIPFIDERNGMKRTILSSV